MMLTTTVFGVIAAVTISGVTVPSLFGFRYVTSMPSRCRRLQVSSTLLCSVSTVMTWLPCFLYKLAAPLIARLFDSVAPDVKTISTDTGWKTFFLLGFGIKSEQNTRLCPETWKAVQKIPNLKTAMFSIFEPGKHLPAHRGPYNGVLRLHLGLIVPENSDRLAIRVKDQICHWQEGKVLIFGPVLDPTDNFGMGVLEVADSSEAQTLMDNDPTVLAGMNKIKISPMVVGAARAKEQA